VRERTNDEVDGVETIRYEATCTELAKSRNTSWMNACTSVVNIGRMKVGTTMNRR
jgi:hypothetical protein